MRKTKSASISIRIDSELKSLIFEKLRDQDKCFSKWLERKIIEEIAEVEESRELIKESGE